MAELPWQEMWTLFTQQMGEARENYAEQLERIRRLNVSETARQSRIDDLTQRFEREMDTIRGGETGRRLVDRYEAGQVEEHMERRQGPGDDAPDISVRIPQGESFGMSFDEFYGGLFGPGYESDITDASLESLRDRAARGRPLGSGTGTALDFARIGQPMVLGS